MRQLLVGIGFMSLTTNVHAEYTEAQCQRECTKEKACQYTFKKTRCERECNFISAEVCARTKTVSPSPVPEASQVARPRANPMPNPPEVEKALGSAVMSRPPSRPAPKPPTQPSATLPKDAPGTNIIALEKAKLLEEIAKRWFEIESQLCRGKLQRTGEKIKAIPPKPEGYQGPYKSAEELNKDITQMWQMTRDAEKTINALASSAEDPKKHNNMIKIFEDIHGIIDLQIKKNCENIFVMLEAELQKQKSAIDTFNKLQTSKEKPSLLQRFKNKLGKKEEIEIVRN